MLRPISLKRILAEKYVNNMVIKTLFVCFDSIFFSFEQFYLLRGAIIIKMSAIQDIGNSTEKSYFPTKGQDMRSRLIFINAVLSEKKWL